jgi:hypothetical protein
MQAVVDDRRRRLRRAVRPVMSIPGTPRAHSSREAAL